MKYKPRKKTPAKTATICDCGSHGFIGLSKGFVALFSPQDAPIIAAHAWHAARCKKWYARATVDGKSVYMHAMLLGGDGKHTDHCNGETLDNQRGNLRKCTPRENFWNTGSRAGSISQFKGVSLNAQARSFRAAIRVNGKSIYLGSFATEVEAAAAYDAAAIEIHGEFARLNLATGHPFPIAAGLRAKLIEAQA